MPWELPISRVAERISFRLLLGRSIVALAIGSSSMQEIPLRKVYASLIEAELEYALFNAERTCPEGAEDIALKSFGDLPGLLDPSRPGIAYFNRIVIVDEEFDPQSLPAEVKGVEVLMPGQSDQNAKSLLAAGFSPQSSLCYLIAQLKEKVTVEARVEKLSPKQTDHFFDLLELSGVDFPADKRTFKKQFYCNGRFRSFVAYSPDGEPTGWATSFVNNGSAFLANAFSLAMRFGIVREIYEFRKNEL